MMSGSQYVLWSIVWIILLTGLGGAIGAVIVRRRR